MPHSRKQRLAQYLRAARRALLQWVRARTVAEALMAVLLGVYASMFFESIRPYWFHPMWTTDDALQQIYPFYKAIYPDAFRGDLITEMMECYLAPLHYWLGMGITWLTGDPIMAGHWLMLIQLVIGMVFLFLGVRFLTGNAAALFAVTWMLHSRLIMQRLTAGLPRGWAFPILTGALYFIVAGAHRGVLVTLAIGCVLHPPATLLVAMCYGLTLLWRVARPSTRVSALPHLRRLILLSPLYAIVTLLVTQMPEHIGTMADLTRAAQMPEFQSPSGRFPFYPLLDIEREMRTFAFQTFITRLHSPGPFLRRWTPEIVLGLLALLVGAGAARKRTVIPVEIWFFLAAALMVYGASRMFAFRLYVPNRHIQIPLAIFFVVAFTVGLWRLFYRQGSTTRRMGERMWHNSSLSFSALSLISLGAIGAFVYRLQSTGLQGTLNFNYNRFQRGEVFEWVRTHTPPDAVIAGHPTFIDPVQLFGIRRGYVTTETAHPFYDRYYQEIARRLPIALRAYYAETWPELLALLEPEGVTHVVFARGHFSEVGLAEAKYFPPFDGLVRELTARGRFAYSSLPESGQQASAPYLVYVDKRTKVVDLARLRSWLTSHPGG